MLHGKLYRVIPASLQHIGANGDAAAQYTLAFTKNASDQAPRVVAASQPGCCSQFYRS